jgi:hypothetical protein
MVADPKPSSYSYEDAAAILSQLGFTLAKPAGGSHRKWRREVADPTSPSGNRQVTIGLVQSSGSMKREYVQDMIAALEANNLLPAEVEKDDVDR